MTRQLDLVRQLYGPSPGAMAANLSGVGDTVRDCFRQLAADPTTARVDALVARLRTAETMLTRLRLALVESHGTG